MTHQTVQAPNFNYLTLSRDDKGRVIVTGETKEGIEIDDTLVMSQFKEALKVVEILERRDAKAYPKGNNYFYKVACQ